MTADRAYRRAQPRQAALDELRAHAGTQFDPAVVDAFLAAVGSGELEADDDGAQTAVDHAAAHIRGLLGGQDRPSMIAPFVASA
jgi:HD-GYP domain-containing protein (c-di-GMP phosphodiesterase class II)